MRLKRGRDEINREERKRKEEVSRVSLLLTPL